ncbi:C39 family peptidase [Allosphingosinicella flava]|uniref:C39 family peptidase n=1 Tax=Allosphingosinicella flava TaxID=2771430 RepID=A0A7T2GLR5_9SPHN|nr:C39 family peptidase [Sphingosinicella flava]QPQ55863.1 C39 family peptidase [Sphingosinicella flava]
MMGERTYRGRRVLPALAIAAASASLVLLMPSPTLAQVRLGTEATGSNFDVNVMSWWAIPFRSVVRQAYDFSCGSAAVATLLTYHFDRPTPEREAFSQMWKAGDQAAIRKVGFSMFDMKTFLGSLGYEAEGYRLSVADLGKMNRPSIVLLDLNGFKHFVVVKGVKEGRVLTGDPMLGLTEYSAGDFKKYWNNIALVVRQTAGGEAPRFNLASDWGPWSRAPMEEGGALRVAASDITDHLPPDYQISPQLLLAVRVGTVN